MKLYIPKVKLETSKVTKELLIVFVKFLPSINKTTSPVAFESNVTLIIAISSSTIRLSNSIAN